jgi:hypothetical protein
MTSLRRTLLLVLLLAITPSAVAAQGGRSSDVDQAALNAMVESARAAGLPVELLIEKAREGVAKRVPAPRITQAVMLLHQRMQVADRLLRDVPRAPANERRTALVALVDALNAGLTEADLTGVIAVLGAAARQPRVVAEVAVTLAELAERGFARASVVRAIAVAWERGGVRAMPPVIAAAAEIGTQVAARDAALEQSMTELHVPSGPGRAPGQQGSTAAREPGPPHDDAFDKGHGRGHGNGKGSRP